MRCSAQARSPLVGGPHSQIVEQKCINIGVRFQSLCRAARPVSRLRINPNQNRIISRGLLLQFGGVLEGMGWNHAIVMVGGRDENGWILDSLPDVVNRRITIEGFELVL